MNSEIIFLYHSFIRGQKVKDIKNRMTGCNAFLFSAHHLKPYLYVDSNLVLKLLER